MRLVPTILCGGAGSRLWPVSRELHPKPFIRLPDGESLVQKAFLRGAQLPGVREIVTVTNRELYFKTRDEFAEVNRADIASSFILEPFGRGTAAAVASAALRVYEMHGEGAALLILPADHLVVDKEAFAAAVSRALDVAGAGRLVAFGVRPHSPEVGYGYIEARGQDVVQFVEKPALVDARAFVESGRFLWNSGMFCFPTAAIIEQMRRHCPDIFAAVQECYARSRSQHAVGEGPLELDSESFARVPDTSIDYAVMEKTEHAAVVSCDICWSDIGSWSALADLAPADERGNRIQADVVLEDVRGCYIRSDDRLVGALGVRDLLIVDTTDALLIAHRERAQEVKGLYAQLKIKGHEAHHLHRTVHRPWGAFTVLEEGAGFKIKRIEVKPGASLSLQMHHHRSEHWIVVSGTASVVNADREFTVEINESTFIPPRSLHRLSNATAKPLVIIEVQSGAYLGEDDIVRFDDQYGRIPAVTD
jgi:mannose-1-phosphate guanylyltransferase